MTPEICPERPQLRSNWICPPIKDESCERRFDIRFATGWEDVELKAKPLLSRKLGGGVDTKCPDTHPTRGRLESNSMSVLRTREPALHRREPAHNTGGRSLPRLQTASPLPSRRQRRPLPRHSLRPQPEVYTSDKGYL